MANAHAAIAEQFDVPDQLLTCLQTSFDAKAQNRPVTMGKVFVGQLMLRMALQSRITHPGDRRMPFQKLRDA